MNRLQDKQFDWIFYTNYYPDLKKAGINTKRKALKHWIDFGRREGRICNASSIKQIVSGSNTDSFKSKLIFELYIRNVTDDTIDTYDKALEHYSKVGNDVYNKKMSLVTELGIKDKIYYYDLSDFIEAYGEYFNGLDAKQIFTEIERNPKVGFRYFCYRYLNYIRNFRIHDVSKNSDKEAVLIEFRKFPHLEFLVRNAIIKLPKDWSHTIVCGQDNYYFMRRMCASISDNIKIVKYHYRNLSVNQYSLLLSSREFWENLSGKKILLYQEDSCIFKSNIDDFISYDYVGAPWPNHQNDNDLLVGNGGLSLRSRDVMLKVIDTISIMETTYNSSTLEYMKNANIIIPPEDVYFSKNIIDLNLGSVASYDVAKKFSVETQYDSSPFAGHNFWISIKDWKEHMHKYVCIQICPPINLLNMLSYYSHRGGWKWVLCNLIKNDVYNTNADINLVDLIEHYSYDNEKNNIIYPIFSKPGNKYIGMIHGTNLGRFDKDPCWLKNVLDDKSKFMSTIDKFVALFTFSNYAKKYISDEFFRRAVQVPLSVLRHPVSFNTHALFDPKKFLSNEDKKLIQLGQQLRYHSAIYRINTQYKKIWLPGFNDQEKAHGFVTQELTELKIDTEINFNEVQLLYLDNYKDYDTLLDKNIVLIYVKDANANNSVLECIVRNTPFVINKHPAIVEYLGHDYPLYFNEVNDIQGLLTDDTIIQAYNYLYELDKQHFQVGTFLNDFLTEIHKRMLRPTFDYLPMTNEYVHSLLQLDG
jgi:hypothetical protein